MAFLAFPAVAAAGYGVFRFASAHSYTLKITSEKDVDALGALEIEICRAKMTASPSGTDIRGIVAQQSGSKHIHCGVLLHFPGGIRNEKSGQVSYYAMVERFNKEILISFTKYEGDALRALTNNSWTPELSSKKFMTEPFRTKVLCCDIADFLKQNMGKECRITRDVDSALQDETYTNCFHFMVTGARMLGSTSIEAEVRKWNEGRGFTAALCEPAVRPLVPNPVRC